MLASPIYPYGDANASAQFAGPLAHGCVRSRVFFCFLLHVSSCFMLFHAVSFCFILFHVVSWFLFRDHCFMILDSRMVLVAREAAPTGIRTVRRGGQEFVQVRQVLLGNLGN